jgi:hypothetical protein
MQYRNQRIKIHLSIVRAGAGTSPSKAYIKLAATGRKNLFVRDDFWETTTQVPIRVIRVNSRLNAFAFVCGAHAILCRFIANRFKKIASKGPVF